MEQLKSIKDSITGTQQIIHSIQSSKLPTYNRQILDPLTSLIKLCLLNFQKPGTKLSISNNKITYRSHTYNHFYKKVGQHHRTYLYNFHIFPL